MTAPETRIRIAAALIIAGLVIESLTLQWSNPIAFVVFVAAGGLALFLGVALFLAALLA